MQDTENIRRSNKTYGQSQFWYKLLDEGMNPVGAAPYSKS